MNQALTAAQIATLKADIEADSALLGAVQAGDDPVIADAYNVLITPAFLVWRTAVAAAGLMDDAFVWTEVDGLTVGRARIWDWMSRLGTINPSKVRVRQGLQNCFGVNSGTYAEIQPYLKRPATRLEKLFATGTGTDANPAVLAAEGLITPQEISRVLRG